MLGRTLAHYEIIALLGKGGMGEVYRARDTKLGREVAIKLLPQELVRDPERIARFQREARTLAALNHPQIAGIHGVEEAEAQRFLVMELAEGEDLSARIAEGPIPVEEAVDIARQIALGLEEAHSKSIVHRDLKPANIKVSADGEVKILDFGLARAFHGETVDEDMLGNSPTITAAMTQQGVVLGTAGYMSPEQAKGKTVDRRADVWSFGVILWEMLTSERLFKANTTSEVLAAVLRAEIPWEDLPQDLPIGVRRLLERCLEREPRSRLQDIGEARIRLERWKSDPSSMHESFVGGVAIVPESRWRTAVPWALFVLATVFAAWGWLGQTPDRDMAGPGVTFEVRLPGDDQFAIASNVSGTSRISPRGDLLAYTASGSLWLRWLDSFKVREVEGSHNLAAFDFSPDGRWLALVARGTLYRVSISGGAPIKICDAMDVRGVAWVGADTIVFPMDYVGGLWAVSVETGELRTLTTVDSTRSERSHRWPRALPDGKSLLMTCQFSGRNYDQSDIQIVSLETGERTTVHRGGSYPIYAETGHLLFARDYTVFAVQLDLETRTTRGLPVPVVQEVETSVGEQEADDGSAHFDVSPQGILLYRTASARLEATQIGEFDFETGSLVEAFGAMAQHLRMALSPDGAWLAVARREEDEADVYLYDLVTRTEHRFTRMPGLDLPGCWSPDSKTLYWTHASGDGLYRVFRQPIDGSAPVDTVGAQHKNVIPFSVSADGRWLLNSVWTGPDGWNVMRIGLEDPGATLEPFATGPGNQTWGSFSPDQHWVTYFSDETGEFQLYLKRFPDTGAVWQLTQGPNRNVGTSFWAPDGRSVTVRQLGGFTTIPLELGSGAVRIGEATRVAADPATRIPNEVDYAVRPDQGGFYGLVGASVRGESASALVVKTNWFPELRRRVAEGR